MSFKGHGEIAIITSANNAHMYIEYLDNFLTPSIEIGLVMMKNDNALVKE